MWLHKTSDYMQKTSDYIKDPANANIATWPNESVKVYLNNYVDFQKNKDCIGKLDLEVVIIKAQYRNKDTETDTCSISISDKISLSQTANLSVKLKFCVGARVMLTDNISAEMWTCVKWNVGEISVASLVPLTNKEPKFFYLKRNLLSVLITSFR